MDPGISSFDSRELRASGKLKGYRPVEPLLHNQLNIHLPDLNKSSAKSADALLIMGMGPVDPVLVKFHGKKVVGIGNSRMKHNALAGVELAVHGFIKKGGVIIPSGTATADPEEVEKAIMDPADAESVYHTTESSLITNYFKKAKSKSGRKIKEMGIEILEEKEATETIENYIFSLNLLDRRSKSRSEKNFEGSIIVVTSKFHIARAYEIAYYLGLSEKVIPLVSQEVLKYFGYSEKDRLFDKESLEYDRKSLWDEQKWIRVIQQLPRYFLPKLAEIEDDNRLIIILKNLKNIYGRKIFRQFSLINISPKNIYILRSVLSSFQRTNPLGEEWLKSDISAVDKATEVHVNFTRSWLNKNNRFLDKLLLNFAKERV